jgi:hypothetical protein
MSSEENKTALATAPAEPVTRQTPTGNTLALVPVTMPERKEYAQIMAASGMFPKFKTPQQAFAAIATGTELGFKPAAALRAIDIIDGKPSVGADALVALCLQRPDLCRYFMVVEETPDSCTVETHRVGAPMPRRMTFTLEQAKHAKLTEKDVWKKYGNRMLYHRASAWLAREVYPDLCFGIYTPDERMEVAEERRGGPQQPQESPAPRWTAVTPAPPAAGATEAPGAPAVDAEFVEAPADPDAEILKGLGVARTEQDLNLCLFQIRGLNLESGSARRQRLVDAYGEAVKRAKGGAQ